MDIVKEMVSMDTLAQPAITYLGEAHILDMLADSKSFAKDHSDSELSSAAL